MPRFNFGEKLPVFQGITAPAGNNLAESNQKMSKFNPNVIA